MRTAERFTPVDRDTIAIEVTVDDPKVYTKPLSRTAHDVSIREDGSIA